MRRLQDTEKVWWYVQRELQETLGRGVKDDETVLVTLVVSALTRMLAEVEEPHSARSAPRRGSHSRVQGHVTPT